MIFDCPAIVVTGPAGELSCVDDMAAPVAWTVTPDPEPESGFWDSSLTMEDVGALLSAILLTLMIAYGFRMLMRLLFNSR